MTEDSDRNFQEVVPRWLTQQPGFVRPIDQSCSRGDLFELLEQVGQDAYNQFRCFWRGELDESADTRVRELRLLNDCVFALSMQANYEIMLEEGKEAAFQSVEEATPEKLQDLLTDRDPIRRKLAIRKWSTLDDTFVAYLSDTARNKEKDTYVRREALDRLGDLSRLNDELIKLVDDIVNEETNPICLRFAAANLIWKHGLFATKGIDQTKLPFPTQIVLEPAATKEAIIHASRDARVISIATHGENTTNRASTIALTSAEQDELKVSDTAPTRSSYRNYLPLLAASLLAAVSISWVMWVSSRNASLRNSNALLTARIERQTESLRKAASLTKELFAETVANSAPLYLSGRTTPGLIRQALQAATTASRSAALTDDQLSDLERSRQLFEGAVSLLKPEDRSTVIEDVTASIWSRNLDQAEELLQRTESPDNPEVINLKGVLAMYQSEYKENSERGGGGGARPSMGMAGVGGARPSMGMAGVGGARPSNLKKEAESFFREAAEKGELIAWINLAILLQLDGRTEEVVNALNSYIENAPADEAAVVREFLPDTTKRPE